MELEGTLDAFSLPDILALLAGTKKTGALHVVRADGRHGAVHLRDGDVTGARSRVERQELGRRLVGAGLVDDHALDKAVERLAHERGGGLGRVLAGTASLDAATVRDLAGAQAVDAVFDLLRWSEGSFAFDPDAQDPDDVGAALPVAAVVGEARERLAAWPGLAGTAQADDAVVVVAPVVPGRPELDAGEWWVLALVDGRRTVAELVDLSGRGEYATVRALAGLVERGLLLVREPGDAALTALHRRQTLLAGVESPAGVAPAPAPGPLPAAAPRPRAGLEPRGRREERPVHASPVPAPAVHAPPVHAPPVHTPPVHAPPVHAPPVPRAGSPLAAPVVPVGAAGPHGLVLGSVALQPEPAADVPGVRPGDLPGDGVDTTLLLRLIAGVRGL